MVRIGDRDVGPGTPCFVIAEIAQTHDGSLGVAHAYIDAVARTGATAIKFQTHIAAAESTPGEPFRIPFSKQDANRYDYWKRMEFTESQWRGLAEHAASVNLVFLSSPFSIEAVELLERVGVPAWKIGAGEVTNLPMLERVAATKKPVLFSSGLSTWDELDVAVALVRRNGSTVAMFQTTTAYPCPPEQLGLNVIAELRERYQAPVGLSDHSATIFAGLAAVSLGANLLEVHVTFTRECFGPDVVASITVDELATMVTGIRFIERALANPVEKNQMAAKLADLKQLFGKSIVASRDLPLGHRVTADDLAYKKPGTGVLAARRDYFLGKSLRRALAADAQFREEDVE
ncbi:MAG TPA: N-acetylneuraminate synthase family protein [Kofleriaceae bacterium]|jgi:N-acetylneuraminate synthase